MSGVFLQQTGGLDGRRSGPMDGFTPVRQGEPQHGDPNTLGQVNNTSVPNLKRDLTSDDLVVEVAV